MPGPAPVVHDAAKFLVLGRSRRASGHAGEQQHAAKLTRRGKTKLGRFLAQFISISNVCVLTPFCRFSEVLQFERG